MTEGVITLDDYAFSYVDDGKGPTLLLVHGSVADQTTFTGNMRRLRSSFRCIAYSRRFHPPNVPPAEGDVYDMGQQADDMIAFIAKTASAPVILVGSSFGAYIGLVAAMRAPGMFRSLVLCEPPIVPLLLHHPEGKPLHDGFVNSVIEPARNAFRKGDDAEGLKIFVEGVRGQPGWVDRLFPSMRADLMRFAPELKAEFLSDYRRYMHDLSPEMLAGIRVPTLLLGGQISRPMFGRILDVLEGSIPGARRAVIPNAGHLLHLQNPAAMETALATILTE